MGKKKKKKFRRVRKWINEMIPVLAGVLIALFLNNWNQNRINHNFIDQAFVSIKNDLFENKKEFDKIIPEHYVLKDSLNHYIEVDSVTLVDIFNKVRGFRMVNVKNTAWKSFMNNPNQNLVDYEIISHLTNIDEDKETLNLQTKNVMDNFYHMDDSRKKKENFLLILEDLIWMQESVYESHEECLKLLGEEIE